MKITIITATYNSSKTLQKTIDSISTQDYKDIEYIIIDGGSTDQTLDIIKRNCKIISNYISEEDNGIYDALNKGIKLSDGEIIGFLNSDDVLANNQVISNIVKCFYETNTDILYGNLIYQSDKKIIRNWISNSFINKSLKWGWMPPHPTLYCKKEIYKKYGLFNNSYKISADYDYMLRIFKIPEIKKFFLPITIVKMEVGGVSNNSMRNIILKSTEDYKAIKTNKVGGVGTLILKNLRKINQFYKRNIC